MPSVSRLAPRSRRFPWWSPDRGFVLTLVRGDHRLNEIKLRNALGSDFRPARAEEIESELGPPGFIGPVGARVPVLKDAAIQGGGYFAGANKPDAHLIGVDPGRDFPFEEVDIRVGGGGGRGARRAADRDRAGDRGGPDLQARDPVLGAAGRQLPRRGGQRAPDRDGQLRDRPGAHSRSGDRTGRRRARDRLASLHRPLGRPSGGARQGRGRGQRGGGADPPGAAGGRGRRSSTTIATPGPGRSSRTRSCSDARCGSRSGARRSPREWSRPRTRRSGAEERLPIAEAAAAALELLDGLD